MSAIRYQILNEVTRLPAAALILAVSVLGYWIAGLENIAWSIFLGAMAGVVIGRVFSTRKMKSISPFGLLLVLLIGAALRALLPDANWTYVWVFAASIVAGAICALNWKRKV